MGRQGFLFLDVESYTAHTHYMHVHIYIYTYVYTYVFLSLSIYIYVDIQPYKGSSAWLVQVWDPVVV